MRRALPLWLAIASTLALARPAVAQATDPAACGEAAFMLAARLARTLASVPPEVTDAVDRLVAYRAETVAACVDAEHARAPAFAEFTPRDLERW